MLTRCFNYSISTFELLHLEMYYKYATKKNKKPRNKFKKNIQKNKQINKTKHKIKKKIKNLQILEFHKVMNQDRIAPPKTTRG